MAEMSQPPLPPNITSQQSPLRQVAANGQQGQAQAAQGGDPMALVESELTQVGNSLTKIAQVLAQTRPDLIAILKPMVQSGAMLQQELKKGKEATQSGTPQGPAAQAPPDAQGGAAAMAA
jgi:hypothetical protein